MDYPGPPDKEEDMMVKVKNPTRSPTADPARDRSEYITEEEGLAFVRGKGLPIGASFFRSLRAKGKAPPTYYFGNSAMFKRAELEEWLPSIFQKGTWSRRPKSGTGAKAKTKVKTKTGEMRAG